MEGPMMNAVAAIAPSHIRDALHAYNQDNYVDVETVKDLHVEGPEKKVIKRDLLRKLSADAKLLINLVLECPERLLNNNQTPSLTKLSAYLKGLGWTWTRISLARTEIQVFTKELD